MANNQEFSGAELKVFRFLLHGRLDLPVSQLVFPSTSGETVSTLKEIFGDVEMRGKIVDLVSRIYRRRGERVLSPLRTTVPFLLALISKCCEEEDEKDQSVLHLALSLFQNLEEEFRLFFRFYVELPFSTNTSNLKLLLGTWYGNKDWRILAKIVCESHGSMQWSHAHIICYEQLIAFDDPCRQAVIDWSRHGSISMHEDERTSELAEVVEYFHNVDNFRETSTPANVLDRVQSWPHGLQNVHPMLTRDKAVLAALIKRINLRELIRMLDQISSLNLFRNDTDSDWDAPFVRHVAFRLESPSAVSEAGLSPGESFVAYHSYLYKWKVMNDSPSDPEEPEDCRIWMPVPQTSEEIAAALRTQLRLSFESSNNLESDILVIIEPNVREHFCADSVFVKADQAAAFIALSLQKSGRNVKIICSQQGSSTVDILGNDIDSIAAAIPSQTSTPSTGHYLDIIRNSISFDSVVLIGHSIRTTEFFNLYNTEENKPKLVLCNLSQARVESQMEHPDILVTSGFNEATCDFITAFVLLHLPSARSKLAHIRRPNNE